MLVWLTEYISDCPYPDIQLSIYRGMKQRFQHIIESTQKVRTSFWLCGKVKAISGRWKSDLWILADLNWDDGKRSSLWGLECASSPLDIEVEGKWNITPLIYGSDIKKRVFQQKQLKRILCETPSKLSQYLCSLNLVDSWASLVETTVENRVKYSSRQRADKFSESQIR